MPARETQILYKTFRDTSRAGLIRPRIQPGTVRPAYIRHRNLQATARWVLGYGPMSLGDQLSGQIMARSLVLPTWPTFTVEAFSNAYMNTPHSVTQSLTGFTDTLIPEQTDESWIFVFLPNAPHTSLQLLIGNITNVTTDGGWGIYQAATSGLLTLVCRGFTNQTLAMPAGRTSTEFVVVGVSITATQFIVAILGGASATVSGTRDLTDPIKTIAVGNKYYLPAATRSYQCGLVERAPVAYTLSALQAAMLNCAKVKQAEGIPVYTG